MSGYIITDQTFIKTVNLLFILAYYLDPQLWFYLIAFQKKVTPCFV